MKAVLKEQTVAEPSVTVASRITGVGMAVPPGVVSNDHFAAYLETSDDWIRERTGIVERRWADASVTTSELSEIAARKALAAAGISPEDVDGIVLATVTPDHCFPSTACFLQSRLGMRRGFAFDVNAVCSGFVYALVTADALIASGQARNILVVGADIYSRLVDPNDRSTCILFGDGAGAVVLSSASSQPRSLLPGHSPANLSEGASRSMRGLYGSELRSDGSMSDILCARGGTALPITSESITRGDHYLKMNGREVFKLAVRSLVEVSNDLLTRLGFSIDDVDYFVSHQANKRILQAMARQLEVPEEKVLCNVNRYGNTSAASLPILLAEAAGEGTIKEGDLVLLSAFGGGVTWGAVLLRW